MHWYWQYGVSYWLAAIGSLIFLSAPFGHNTRRLPAAIRAQMFLLGLILLAWSALGWYLLAHSVDGTTSLAPAPLRIIEHTKSLLAGIAIGLFSSVLLNRAFYSPGKHGVQHLTNQ